MIVATKQTSHNVGRKEQPSAQQLISMPLLPTVRRWCLPTSSTLHHYVTRLWRHSASLVLVQNRFLLKYPYIYVYIANGRRWPQTDWFQALEDDPYRTIYRSASLEVHDRAKNEKATNHAEVKEAH
jgi:hypothetical protein